MNLQFIALPSGIIINLHQVCLIEGSGIFKDEKPENGKLNVYFSASQTASVSLKGNDIKSFLDALRALDINTEWTMASVSRNLN
jgi:hypothetical protein